MITYEGTRDKESWQDIVNIDEPELSSTLIFKEIPTKQKGYIVVRRCLQHFRERLEDMVNLMLQRGAAHVYVTVSDHVEFRSEEAVNTGKHIFIYDSDMDRLQVELSHHAIVDEQHDLLNYERLNADNSSLFIELYNDCFHYVPNSATYTMEDAVRISSSNSDLAWILRHEADPVGICEVCCDSDIPEIASIGICAPFRGMGLGHAAMKQILHSLWKMGHRQATLTVSSANPRAYQLYRALHFERMHTLTRWYRSAN